MIIVTEDAGAAMRSVLVTSTSRQGEGVTEGALASAAGPDGTGLCAVLMRGQLDQHVHGDRMQ